VILQSNMTDGSRFAPGITVQAGPINYVGPVECNEGLGIGAEVWSVGRRLFQCAHLPLMYMHVAKHVRLIGHYDEQASVCVGGRERGGRDR
jgi:hypothetical protein